MKTFTLAAAAFGLISQSNAFPALMTNPNSPVVQEAIKKGLIERDVVDALMKRQDQGVGAPEVAPIFDANSQFISTSGQYKFVAPGPLDGRGMCPGLNAMANHGYLPHNGYATIAQFIDATTKVFGMGVDLATFLAVYGAVVDGNLAGWSIGGVPHTGIAGSHGNYEGDSSPCHADINQYGDERLVLSQFQELFDLQPNGPSANYNLQVLRDFRASRFQESINYNPYFTYNAFAGIAVSQAAFTFIYRFMANHSAEHPAGVLNGNVLKSFFSVTGDSHNFKWTPGYNRIPDNWYRRNTLDAYTIPYFQTDILYFAEAVPQILAVGCNQGAVNTYNTFSAATLSGGAYTVESAAKNPLCFAAATVAAGASSLLGVTGGAVSQVTGLLDSVSKSLGMTCPPIQNLTLSALTVCPGFSLYGGPKASVPKGAIQPAYP